MDASSAVAASRSVRGDEYARVRVDVAASELTLGPELASGGASVVFSGTFAGARVAVKRPRLRTRADMDRYHKELQLVRHAHACAAAACGRWLAAGARLLTLRGARSTLEHANVLGIVAARAWPPEYYLIFPLMARRRLRGAARCASRKLTRAARPQERGSLAELLHEQRLRPTWQARARQRRPRPSAEEPCAAQAVLRHGAEIAAGLAYLHAAGIVHRDIKPANVLVGADWVARIGACV